MNVSAIIVTRGDVDLTEPVHSIRKTGIRDIIVWDNSREWKSADDPYLRFVGSQDLAVYGRYAAIQYARYDLIYVQDDDCVVPPSSITEIIWASENSSSEFGVLACNMPSEFRHSFYEDHALVGFGACFHRSLPEKAFARFFGSDTGNLITRDLLHYYRCCDVVFTGLTTRTLVDVPYENLPWASAENRMWKQPEHVAERARMLELVKGVRDASS